MGNSYEKLRRLSESHAKIQTLMHYVNRENLKAEHRVQVKGYVTLTVMELVP